MSEIEVKALEWREWKTERGWQAESALGQYQVSWLGDWECWQCFRPHKNGTNWSDNFSKHASSAEAKAAAQKDFEARILSALAVGIDWKSITAKIAHHVTRMNREEPTALALGEAIARDCNPLFEALGMSLDADGWGFSEDDTETEKPEYFDAPRPMFAPERPYGVIINYEPPSMFEKKAALSASPSPVDSRDGLIERLVKALEDQNLEMLTKDIRPFGEKPIGSIRIDMNDVRSILALYDAAIAAKEQQP